MEYDLVFDSAQGGFRTWWFGAAGLLFVLAGAVLVKNSHKLPPVGGMGPASGAGFAYVFLLFSVGWTTLAFTATGLDYLAVRHGDAEVVEGRVENFIPMPYEGHARERFSVCGVPFSYSDYIVTAGFHQTSSHGGPIRAGLWVRLSYVDDKITRVEIAKRDPGMEAQCHRGRESTGR